MPNMFHPKHPERICWGCDRYCPADHLSCGNGTIRTPHPMELLGDDWCDAAEETPCPERKELPIVPNRLSRRIA